MRNHQNRKTVYNSFVQFRRALTFANHEPREGRLKFVVDAKTSVEHE